MSTRKKPAPLREQIIAFLKTHDEATLKQIAASTSERDFPSRVITELNKMRTDTLIECAKKKGKNELWYWLAATEPQPEVGKNTGSRASVPSSHSAEGVAVRPEPAPQPKIQAPGAARKTKGKAKASGRGAAAGGKESGAEPAPYRCPNTRDLLEGVVA